MNYIVLALKQKLICQNSHAALIETLQFPENVLHAESCQYKDNISYLRDSYYTPTYFTNIEHIFHPRL